MNQKDDFIQFLKLTKVSLKTKILLIVSSISLLSVLCKSIINFFETDLERIKITLESNHNGILDFLFYLSMILFAFLCIWVFFQKPPKEIFYNISRLHDFTNSIKSREVSFLNFITRQKDLSDRFERANDSVEEFMKWFKWIWIGWLLLYLTTCFFKVVSDNNDSLNSFDDLLVLKSILTNSSNNISSLFFFFCLLVLNKIAVQNKEKKFKVKIGPKWIFILLIIIVTEIILHYIFPHDQQIIANSFAAISGLLAMISMSLLIGRLDSKLIDRLPTGILVILYGYAGIQLYLPFFIEENNTITLKLIGLIYLALFCKIVLLIFISWIIDTNRLFFYFLAVFGIHNEINNQWNKIKDAFITKSKITNNNISGIWKVNEYYFSENSYGGFVTGKLNLKLFQGKYYGTVKLKDKIEEKVLPNKDSYFKVLQDLEVIREGNDINFIGSNPKIIKTYNVTIEEYSPDHWIGIQIDDNTIIGYSKDINNIQGHFYFERIE